MEHIVFLTGRLAEPALRRVLCEIAPPDGDAPFAWEIREIGLQVAALMTADMIRRRVAAPVAADRIIVPGRCRGDLDALTAHFGMPVQRGPEELKDLPAHFNRLARPVDLDAYGVAIFAEIVDAPRLGVDAIVERALSYVADGADVIDLGGLPDTAFPHLEHAQMLRNRRLANREGSRDLAGGAFAFIEQTFDDGEPGRVGERAEDGWQGDLIHENPSLFNRAVYR